MLLLTLVILATLFGFGYATRSYVGVLVPLTLFVLAAIDYRSREEPAPGTGDEVDVLSGISVVLTGIAVLTYLGAVALGRRFAKTS
jgi:hypothetical protein